MGAFVQFLERRTDVRVEFLRIEVQFALQEGIRQAAPARVKRPLAPGGTVHVRVLLVPGASLDRLVIRR